MPKNMGKTIHKAPNFCNCDGPWHFWHFGFFTNHLKLVNSIPAIEIWQFPDANGSYLDFR